jgi:hypothetical protein
VSTTGEPLRLKIPFLSRELVLSDQATCTIASRVNFFDRNFDFLKFEILAYHQIVRSRDSGDLQQLGSANRVAESKSSNLRRLWQNSSNCSHLLIHTSTNPSLKSSWDPGPNGYMYAFDLMCHYYCRLLDVESHHTCLRKRQTISFSSSNTCCQSGYYTFTSQ